MQHSRVQVTAVALACVLMAGCTVYSPVWIQHDKAPAGPPMTSASTGALVSTSLVNRCEIVDIGLSVGYKCLDYGFRSTEGKVVRLRELRGELKAFGPQIGHLTEAEKKRFTNDRVRYALYLLALKPSVYVGVPIARGDAPWYCGDITCVEASWRPEKGPSGDASLRWREAPPAREGSFYFVPGVTPTSQPLPVQGTQLALPGNDRLMRISPRAGVWTAMP